MSRLQRLKPYLFLLPALTILFVAVFLPAIQAFSLSFSRFEYDLTQPPQWVGWSNFEKLMQDRVFQQTVRNTLLYVIGVVPPLVILSLLLAILVNQRLPAILWFRTIFYTPVVVSMVVAGLAWKAIYLSNGLFNQFWLSLGFKEGIGWLTNPKWAIWSVMIVTIWKGLGYYMVIYLAGLQSIPPSCMRLGLLMGL